MPCEQTAAKQLLLKVVTDFAQQNNFFRSGWQFCWRLLFHPIELFHQHEHNKGQNEEIDYDGDEIAIGKHGDTSLLQGLQCVGNTSWRNGQLDI